MSFDIVYLDLFKEDIKEQDFLDLGIDFLFVLKEVDSKKDLIDFKVPEFKKIKTKKIFITKNLSLISIKKDYPIFFISKDISKNQKITSYKNIDGLVDPTSDTLSFDESNAKMAFKNNIPIIFDLNKIYNSRSCLKQTYFILNILENHLVDFCFASFSKTKKDLFDFKIVNKFLDNFDIDLSLKEKILNKDILCKRKK